METRKCNQCKEVKPVNEFYRLGLGYQYKCKICRLSTTKKSQSDYSLLEGETFYPIKKLSGRYEVSDLGRFRSVDYKDTIGRLVRGKIFNGTKNQDGYLDVHIRTKEGKDITEKIHILVAETLIPNPENKPQVNHIGKDANGKIDKTDNRVKSLEWATALENMQHAKDNGLIQNGENHPQSKLTNNQVLEIFKSKLSGSKLGRIYGVNRSHIHNIKSGKRWSAVTGENIKYLINE